MGSRLRIIAGTAKGRRIKAPKGEIVRPTSEKVRGAILDILHSVEGLRVIDLFAGTGAMGLEALSRGAISCVFLEQDRRALAAIETNVEVMGFEELATVKRADLSKEFPTRLPRVQLVFVDPPYRWEDYEHVLREIVKVLAPGGLAVVEHDAGRTLEAVPGLEIVDRRTWGSTGATFLRVAETENA